jgi:hypothetical protein
MQRELTHFFQLKGKPRSQSQIKCMNYYGAKYLQPALCYVADYTLVLAEQLPKRRALARSHHHKIQRPIAKTNEPHAMMYTSRTKSALCNLKPSTFTQQDAVQRYTHVVKPEKTLENFIL